MIAGIHAPQNASKRFPFSPAEVNLLCLYGPSLRCGLLSGLPWRQRATDIFLFFCPELSQHAPRPLVQVGAESSNLYSTLMVTNADVWKVFRKSYDGVQDSLLAPNTLQCVALTLLCASYYLFLAFLIYKGGSFNDSIS